MTKLANRKNIARVFPSMMNEFLPNRFFNGSLFDFDDDVFTSTPPVNIIESEKQFTLDLSAAGMDKEDFKINLENGVLTISADKETSQEDDDKNYKRREFSYSSFSRTFALPDNIDERNIRARYENGILELILPKKEGTISKPKKHIVVK